MLIEKKVGSMKNKMHLITNVLVCLYSLSVTLSVFFYYETSSVKQRIGLVCLIISSVYILNMCFLKLINEKRD